MLVQLIEHNVRIYILSQLNHDAHAVTVRLIPQVGNSLNLLFPCQVSYLLDQARLVYLIRQLRYHNARLAVGHSFHMSLGTHLHRTSSRSIGILYASSSHNQAAGREVRTLDDSHQLLHGSIRIVNQHQHTINNLVHIVRRYVSCHAYSNTGSTID